MSFPSSQPGCLSGALCVSEGEGGGFPPIKRNQEIEDVNSRTASSHRRRMARSRDVVNLRTDESGDHVANGRDLSRERGGGRRSGGGGSSHSLTRAGSGLSGQGRRIPRRLRRRHRIGSRRHRRHGEFGIRPAGRSQAQRHRAAPYHRPTAPGGGGCTRSLLDDADHRQRQRYPFDAGPSRRRGRRLRSQQLSPRLQQRRRRRLCRRHRRRQSRHCQSEFISPGHDEAAR